MSHTTSFRRRLLHSFLLVGIVPLLICVVFLLNLFQLSLERNTRETARTQLASLSASLDDLLSSAQEIMGELAQQPAVRMALAGDRSSTSQSVYSALYASANRLLRGADFALYDSSGHPLYSTSTSGDGADLPLNWGVLAAAREGDGVVYRSSSPAGSGMEAALAVRMEDRVVGYVVAELTPVHFRRLFQDQYAATSAILLLDPFWAQVYASPSLQDQSLVPRLREQLLQAQPLSDRDGAYHYHVHQDELTGFYLVLQQPRPISDGTMQILYLVAILSIILCLALCLVVSMGLTRQLFEPIQALNGAMAAVEAGDLDTSLPVTGTDEMSQLAGRFNRMTQQLKTNLADSLRQQKELGDTQIRLMQAQLNPHFLYNTLDTLKWMGKIHQVPQVSILSADLADILRSSISAQEFVPLSQELQLLDRYVDIQKIRFSGKFQLEVQADPSVLDALVPKLMLQPLVENSIVHGLDSSGGRITVTARPHGGELMILVRDDGCGISEESLQQFYSGEGTGSHLGLRNVDAILRLHYGPDRGLRFLPVDQGTCIRITLPLNEPAKGEAPPCGKS